MHVYFWREHSRFTVHIHTHIESFTAQYGYITELYDAAFRSDGPGLPVRKFDANFSMAIRTNPVYARETAKERDGLISIKGARMMIFSF